jgi:hypothetical protein
MLPDARYGCELFAGGLLPSLKHLVLGADPAAGDQLEDQMPPAFLDDLGLVRMVASCLQLQHLVMPGCIADGAQLVPLLLLIGLTNICLAGDEIDDDRAEHLADLTDLTLLLSKTWPT